jgi:hypothetical protein
VGGDDYGGGDGHDRATNALRIRRGAAGRGGAERAGIRVKYREHVHLSTMG